MSVGIGDRLFILPAHSMRFAKRWGRVVGVNNMDLLPVKVQFDGDDVIYGFSHQEYLRETEYNCWPDKLFCRCCGRDISGEFRDCCEDCEYPLPEEDR